MKKNYTENDLIRFMYAETIHNEDLGIAFQLENEANYNHSFRNLIAVKRMLDECSLKPSNAAVSKVLEYSARA